MNFAWRFVMAESLGPTLPGRSLLLHDAPPDARPARWAFAAKGFRPFFFLATLFAVAIVPMWLLVLSGTLPATTYLPAAIWHAHEMIFGFVGAVIAGFLLTAVGNWTKRETVVGNQLLALAGLWLAGRGAVAFAGSLPRALVALTDMAFWFALLFVLARTLFAANNRRNFVVLGIVAALGLANGAVHLEATGVFAVGAARRATVVSVDLVLVLVGIIAGRTFPMFTRNTTGVNSIQSNSRLDVLAIVVLVALVVFDLILPSSSETAVLAGVAGVFSAWRAVHWGARYSVKQPLLWILHAGYAWLPLGLLLRAGAELTGLYSSSLGLHAVTVGCIGSLTLGMMARVSLGHTGRLLAVSGVMSIAFVAINLAALVRVFLPLFSPSSYFTSLIVAGSLWALSFGIFVVVYAPVLFSPRVDGRPG